MGKTGFLETRPGYKSSTRLNTLIILIFWITISTYQVLNGGFANFEFHILILTAAFAPKTITKFAEKAKKEV
jgi:hypothetical protein